VKLICGEEIETSLVDIEEHEESKWEIIAQKLEGLRSRSRPFWQQLLSFSFSPINLSKHYKHVSDWSLQNPEQDNLLKSIVPMIATASASRCLLES
jgi:hypothetical protein